MQERDYVRTERDPGGRTSEILVRVESREESREEDREKNTASAVAEESTTIDGRDEEITRDAHEDEMALEDPAAAGDPTEAPAKVSAEVPLVVAEETLDVAEVEARLREEIRQRIQPEQYQTWFRRAALVGLADGRIELAVQNNFARDWLCSYYRTVLRDAAHAVLGKAWEFTLSVDPELTAEAPRSIVDAEENGADQTHATGNGARAVAQSSGSPGASSGSAGRARSLAQQAGGQQHAGGGPAPGWGGLVKGSPSNSGSGGPSAANAPSVAGVLYESDFELNEKYTFDNFVVGPCNRFAHAAAFGAAESPGKAYNPFFLHGSVGLGKTHLLQSICFSLLERRPETRILFLSCETFVNHFINALEHGDIQRFRQKYRNVDVLVVDDIHLLANKERTQEEFFHTFNTLYNSGKQIVLSSDSPPKDIPKLQERLVSRFKWGLVTEIESPCYETRMAILIRKSRERGREIDERVASLLAEHIDTNIRELEGAVNRLLTFAGLAGREITVELAREVLRDVFQVRKGAPTMDDIIRVVIDHFGVKLPELQSRKRTNAIAFPRQVVMYLARKITRHSLEEIGGFLGGRDHSTVLYAVEKISRLAGEDAETRKMIERFLESLESPRS